jgi:hypothetical protein
MDIPEQKTAESDEDAKTVRCRPDQFNISSVQQIADNTTHQCINTYTVNSHNILSELGLLQIAKFSCCKWRDQYDLANKWR